MIESGLVIADMSGETDRQVLLKGGRGGKGNHELCHTDDAGSEICPAGTEGPGIECDFGT